MSKVSGYKMQKQLYGVKNQLPPLNDVLDSLSTCSMAEWNQTRIDFCYQDESITHSGLVDLSATGIW